MAPRKASGARKPKTQNVTTGRVTRARKPSNSSRALQDAVEKVDDPNDTLEPIYGKPPAWADCRPDLCDALPWFRSVQGAVYHVSGLCWGFMIDSDCGERSYMDDEVVITRAGGGCAKDADGNLVLVKDQDTEGALISSIIASMDLKVPVGMVIGNQNTLLGRKIPHKYNVLDYFRATDVWFERVGKKIGARVRFEKLDISKQSWWSAGDAPPPVPYHERDAQPEIQKCSTCSVSSKRVYKEGWMCLHTSCDDFWSLNGSPPPEDLTFCPSFLNYRNAPDSSMKPHYSLVPDLLSTINTNDEGVASSRIAWKGIVCPICRKCVSRRFWRGWKCTDDIASASKRAQNPCRFEKMVEMNPISLRSVIDEFEMGPIKRAMFFDSKTGMVPEIDDISLSPYRKLTYKLPGVGSITHIVSNKAINSRRNGPNDLFKQLQVSDLGLRRFPLQQSVVSETLTAHFSVNYGMPYRYIVAVDSKGFDEAPSEILYALGRLTWATEKASQGTGDTYLAPNELLVIGYFEQMKIGYHDDGESSLGPTVATLSLGSRSTMMIRMKAKYYNGFSLAKKVLDDDPVVKGCKLYDERQELKMKFEKGQLTPKAYKDARQELFKSQRSSTAHPCIKMELNHGDLVVMHGENLQKYFEHSVIPEDKLRFALTARYIKPEHLDATDMKKGRFSLLPDQIYDGK